MEFWAWLLRKTKMRRHWHVCNTCMGQTGHDTRKSVFYSEEPPVYVLGRPWTECPRCGGTNTKSLQDLKNEGADAAVWGLERIVRKLPRREYQFRTPATKVTA